MLEGPKARRGFVGVFVAAEAELTDRVMVQAALKILPPSTVAIGSTALRHYGVEVGSGSPLRFCSTHSRQVRRPGIAMTRVRSLPPASRCIASPEHAFASAAQELDLLGLVTAGDWLLRLRRCSLASLRAYAAVCTARGAVRARRAAALVRERVDSPRETRLRLILVLAGLPDPECNVTIGTDDRPIGRVDLIYQQYRLIIEYEGDQHRSDRYQWNTDIHRHEGFAEGVYILIRHCACAIRAMSRSG
jgi:hypothetical protein